MCTTLNESVKNAQSLFRDLHCLLQFQNISNSRQTVKQSLMATLKVLLSEHMVYLA